MDINTLSSLLRELILTNDRVSLPGMGSFIAEIAPSVFSDRAMVIHPPFRRLLFRTNEIWNDELLENLYAKEAGLDIEVAKGRLSVFLKDFKNELNSRKSVRIPDFGTMRATDQNDYFFVVDKDIFIYPDAYGLEPINIKLLPKPGLIEVLNYRELKKVRKPLKISFPKQGKTSKQEVVPTIARTPKEKKKLSKRAKRSIIILSVIFGSIALIPLMGVIQR